jgi:CheY-like chemotaxis protein
MLQENLYEIVALIAVLTILVIYFLTRRFKQEEENKDLEDVHISTRELEPQEEIVEESSIINEEINTTKDSGVKEEEEKEEEEAFVIGNEEGSFGHIEQNPFEEKAKQNTKKHYKLKCEVPPHGKISKENFKEFAGTKILIAEDNIINQKVLSGLLAGSGIEITMADDGQIALDILEKNNDFNMILMDAHMPRVDGFEATRIIRANPNYDHIVIVALSGDTAADDIKKMTDSGMQEHLEKPLKMDAFYDILYAYTKVDKTHNNSEFVEVIMTKELNGDKGLEVCGGDESFYRDILDEFTNNYTKSAQSIQTLLENNEIDKADALLLDIVGLSANIGADNINSIAINLKEAIKDTDKSTSLTLLNQYEKHLKVLLKDIKDYKNL